MNYNILTVRSAEEQDGLLYPVIGDGPAKIALEKIDGKVQTFGATALMLRQLKGGRTTNLMSPLRDIKADVMVSDARVAVACEKYAKGDNYIGIGLGATLAEINKYMSRKKAERETRGTMLVGQVRYSWLQYVGYKPKKPLISPGILRVVASELLQTDEVRSLFLDVSVPKAVNPAEAAQSVVQRAARYWLGKMEIEDPSMRPRFEELADAPILPNPESGHFATYELPVYQYANPATAMPSGI